MTISDSRFIPSLALLYFFNRPFFFLEKGKIFWTNFLRKVHIFSKHFIFLTSYISYLYLDLRSGSEMQKTTPFQTVSFLYT